jgi:hypothetical protein
MSHQPTARLPHDNWENEGGSVRPPVSPESLGVTRIVSETFAVGPYRYTNLADAVAQARRTPQKVAGL